MAGPSDSITPERIKREEGVSTLRALAPDLCVTAAFGQILSQEILDIPEKSVAIESRLVALAAWMKESYGGTMIQALKTVLPIKRKERERTLPHSSPN